MAQFKSEETSVNASSEVVFDFLKDLNNLEPLIVNDKISEWQSTETECSFKVPNMGKIGFKFDSADQPNKIVLKSISDKPFGFTMNLNITAAGDTSQVQIVVDADINPMLKMMVEKPLTQFFDSIARKMGERSF